MKIDKIKLKRSLNDLPQSCRDIIQLFKTCSDQDLLAELKLIITWNFGKSELYHWIDVLNRFDQVLSECTQLPPDNPLQEPDNIYLVPDISDPEKRELVLHILSFTSLLIENANARQIYYSMEHLIALLTSNDLEVVLASLNVIFVFSKRCHYISRLPIAQRNALTNRLFNLAESMGGKESGFGLKKISQIADLQSFPTSATSVHFEFPPQPASADEKFQSDGVQSIELENLYSYSENPQQILQHVLKTVKIPRLKQSHLLYRIQRAMHFPNFNLRCQCIDAQLTATSILIYSGFVPDFIQTIVDQGLIEELVELLEIKSDDSITMKLKATCFRNLTALIQQERETRNFPTINKIVSALDCQNYYGFLASLVRKIIKSMTEMNVLLYSQSFITTLFSFLYHMAINEPSAAALIASGHIEFLIQVISWKTDNPLNVSLVTRAVRVIDLLSTLDIQPTQAKSICDVLFDRLEMEMEICKRDAPHALPPVAPMPPDSKSESEGSASGEGEGKEEKEEKGEEAKKGTEVEPMELEEELRCTLTCEELDQVLSEMRHSTLQCLPQRSALIKSLLNFFKKAASDLYFPETLRNLCESPLLPHLKHIISNVEYYGPTLYLPATEIVTNYILNEPSHLTPLQMTGLPGVVLNSLLLKPIPPTVDILTALPNMLSALCLNTRGLTTFLQAQPFDRLFSILISPEYLSAMRKRKNIDATAYDVTPSVLGSSMDQLMRHQPTLRNHVFDSLIRLLERILDYGTNPDWIIIPFKGDSLEDDPVLDPEEGMDDNSPTSSDSTTLEKPRMDSSNQALEKSKQVPLIEYILNVIRFITHIVATKSYNDEHLTEFQQRGGISLLLKILCMPNLPLDFSNSPILNTILNAIKQIVEFMKNPQELLELIISQHLSQLLDSLSPLYETSSIGLKSVLMSCTPPDASPSSHSLLHRMCITQHFISLLANLHKTNNEVRSIKYLSVWTKDENSKLVLKQLSYLHNSLFWESALLLNEPVSAPSLTPVPCPAREVDRLIPNDEQSPVTTPNHNGESSSDAVTDKKPASIVIKKLKPCFHVIRQLGSNLTDLFTHLVRFACSIPGTRGKANRNSKGYLHENCMEMAQVLVAILKEKLVWQPDIQDSKYGRDVLHLVRSCLIISSSNFLFDERNQPYLLMLAEFEKREGMQMLVELYEDSFNTITHPCQDKNSLTYPVSSCDKWLSAWLNFIEKLLNINLVLHSQNTIPSFKPAASDAQNPASKPISYPFEPVNFLINAQQLFIQPLKVSWKLLNSLSCPGSLSLLEPHLTLLHGIVQGESTLKEKLEQLTKKDSSPTQPQPQKQVFVPDPLHLEKLTEMGFSAHMAGKALQSCSNNIAQALEWLMTHPEEQEVESMSEDDHFAKAIALSLDNELKEEPPIPKILNLREDLEFVDEVISCSAQFLKKMPQAVYRIVPLFTVITENWGPSYIQPSLHLIFKEFNETAKMIQSSQSDSPVHQHLYSLILLLLFLFENLTLNTFSCTEGSPIQDHCINLLSIALKKLGEDVDITIEWLSPLILFIDLLEKHAQMIIHRDRRPTGAHTWSWLNTNRGGWSNFSPETSTLIDNAFSEGAASVPITEKNNRYILNLETMAMRGIDLHSPTYPIRYTKKPEVPKDDESETPTSSKETELVSKDVPDSHGDQMKKIASDLALNYDQKVTLITYCASLLKFVKNTSLLQAVLQLSIRLTKDYRIALIFGKCKGCLHLFSLKKDMLFSGFQALTSILMRHLFESENAMRYMMENAIRGSHHYHSPPMNSMPYRIGRRDRNTKDLDSFFRSIGPIYNKNPTMFKEIAKEVFKLDVSQLLIPPDAKNSDLVKLVPRKKPCTSLDNSSQESFLRDLLELLYLGHDSINTHPAPTSSLLSSSMADPLSFSRGSSIIRLPRNRFHPFERLHGNTLRGDIRNFSMLMDLVDDEMEIDELSELAPLSLPAPVSIAKTKVNPSEQPIVGKSGILRLLAELILSYPMCASFICQEKLPKNGDTTVLTYILDNLLHESDVAKLFLNTIGGHITSNIPDVQNALINEIKLSILRISQISECHLKHAKLRALLTLINEFVTSGKEYVLNIAKLMIRKNFASDLAKIFHSFDLNSSELPETANLIMKTIESLTNQMYKTPGHPNQPKKQNKATDSQREEQSEPANAPADPQTDPANQELPTTSQPANSEEAANNIASGDVTLIDDPSYNEMMMMELSGIDKEGGQENEDIYLSTAAENQADISDDHSSSTEHSDDSESEGTIDDTEELRDDPDNCNSAGEELDYDVLDESGATEVGEHSDVRVVISLGPNTSQNLEGDDLPHSSPDDDDDDDDDDPSIDLDETDVNELTEDPENTVVDDDIDIEDEPAPSDVLLGSTSSNEEQDGIPEGIEIESDVTLDSEAETEEMSDVTTFMGQHLGYDTAFDEMRHSGLGLEMYPILRRQPQYNITRSIFRESIFSGMPRSSNSTRIPSHPLLNRQQSRPNNPQPPSTASSLRVSDPQRVLQLVSSNRSGALPDAGLRALPTQRRRLVLEHDQLVFEEDPLIKEQGGDPQDNEDELFVPTCILRLHQEDGILGSCHNFQSLKKAQEEIAEFLRAESAKEREEKEKLEKLKRKKNPPETEDITEPLISPAPLSADFSPPPIPPLDVEPVPSNISMPSPSDQPPAPPSLPDPSTEVTDPPADFNTQLPTDSPMLLNQIDGSQQSARAALQQMDSNHPLYTFFSAVAGNPPPPNPLIPISPSTTAVSSSPATALTPDTSSIQLTAPPTVTTMDRPREGPAGDTSHVPPDTNIPVDHPSSISIQNAVGGETLESNSASIFTPITPIDSNLLPPLPLETSSSTETPEPSHDPPIASEEANAGTNSEGDTEAPAPAASGPTILRSIDPEFLAAIPEHMRIEILREEQELRNVLDRGRTPNTSAGDRSAAPTQGRSRHELDHVYADISTEVLAEMPADIQDEIISQRRMQEQRQRLGTSDDPASFLETLPRELRQSVLNEMDEETFGNLPSGIQEEATQRHRSRQRNYIFDRQMMTEPPFAPYDLLSLPTPSFYLRRFDGHHIPPYAMARRRPEDALNPLNSDSSNKPPLDFEALICLLSVLFVDSAKVRPKFNQLIRLLCEHKETKDWILSILTYFLADINLVSLPDCSVETAPPIVIKVNQSNSGQYSVEEEPMLEDQHKKLECISIIPHPKKKSPSWMSISQTCGTGVQNIIHLETPSGKGSKPAHLHLHSQAQNFINNNVLDAFLHLFSQNYFLFNNQSRREAGSMSRNFLEPTNSALLMHSKFWECLIKLESTHINSKGKGNSRSHFTLPNLSDSSNELPLVHIIISLLNCDQIRTNQTILDKLIKLLSHICQNLKHTSSTIHKPQPNPPMHIEPHPDVLNVEIPEFPNPTSSTTPLEPAPIAETEKPIAEKKEEKKPLLFSNNEVDLIISLLSCKTCNENSLNHVNVLVMKLAKYHPTIMKHIYSTLIGSCKEIGVELQSELETLKVELFAYNTANPISSEEAKLKANKDPLSFYTLDQQKLTKSYRPDLHLESMSPFLSKFSNVSLFLRMLKIIQMLRKEIQLINLSDDPLYDWDGSFDMPPQHNGFRDRLRNDMRRHVQELTQRSDEVAEEIQEYMQVLNEDPDSFDEEALRIRTTVMQEALTRRRQERGIPPNPKGNRDPGDSLLTPSIKKRDSERLSVVLNLSGVWELLEDCLEQLGMTCHDHAVLVMQNMVECFFIVHAGDKESMPAEESEDMDVVLSRFDREGSLVSLTDLPDTFMPPSSPTRSISSQAKDDPDMAKFLKFADCHRIVLNQILRQTTTPLSSGTFSILINHTRLLDFDVKREYFRQELEATSPHSRREDMIIQVSRKNVFEESFRQLSRKTPDEMKNKLYIIFKDEDGQDAGGLLREWYLIISREIFNPDYALFTTTPGDRVTYVPNSCSYVNKEHLDYFKFVGRLIAKAIYDNKLLDCYFGRSFYKHILSKPVQYTDLEAEDYGFYKSMLYLMEHDLNEIGCELTFSTEIDDFGVMEVKDLVKNGRNLTVTEENKKDYVRLVCQMKMTGAIHQQIKSFLGGFYEIIPKKLISIFNEQELELLISGLPNVDIDDLKANTEYYKYNENSMQIQWFWRALRSFDQADRAKFLQFVTGTSKVPLRGFAFLEGMNGIQKFQIHKDERSDMRLPSAHTCFNQLDLPAYSSYEDLRTALLYATQECPEGFGLA